MRLKPQGPGPDRGRDRPGTTKIYKVGPLWAPEISVLSRVKNEIRTTMSDERLNAVSLMAIKNKVVRSLDFECY